MSHHRNQIAYPALWRAKIDVQRGMIRLSIKETDMPDDQIDMEDLKIETLSGDLRDAMLIRFRDMKRPWSMLSESEQREFSNGLEMAANSLVRQTVSLMSDYDFPRCTVTLGEVKIRGEKGIEAKISAPNIEVYRNVLGDHVGTMVTMLMVDSEGFMSEREPAKIDPDQPSLPVD